MKSFKLYNDISWKQIWLVIQGIAVLSLVALGIVGFVTFWIVIPTAIAAVLVILLIGNNSGRGMAW